MAGATSPNKTNGSGSPDPASRLATKKQPVGTTGAVPGTRASKTTKTASQTLADAEKKVTSLDTTTAILRGRELIPSDRPSAEDLISGLARLATKSTVAPVTEGLIAFAYYAKAVIDDLVSITIAESVLTKFQDQAGAVAAALEARVVTAGEQLQEHSSAIVGVGETIRGQLEQAIKGIERAGGDAGARGASSAFERELSYADAVHAPLPGPDRAAQIRVADRERLLARQVLVDGFPVSSESGGEPSATDILAMANDAALFMQDQPEGFRFTAARRLTNGGVILETPRSEQAEWLRAHASDFEWVLGEKATVRQRLFHVVVEFAPIAFDPQAAPAWREVERDLSIPLGSIAEARWIKLVERRHNTQCFAHLLLTLTSSTAANAIISAGATIAGKRVSVRKNLMEPMRCAKCHRYNAGHLAKDCSQAREVCGTCGRAHRTRDCTRQDLGHHRCANCNADGHPTWSRDCPVFLDHLRRMDVRHPKNHLRFFPTADPDSWVPRLDDPLTDSLWNVVQDSLNWGPPPPSQRRRAERAEQARLTQSTLNFTPQGAPQEEVNA